MTAGGRAIVVAAVLALSACTGIEPRPVARTEPWLSPGHAVLARDAEVLLLYFDYARRMQGPDLAKEQERVGQALLKNPTDFVRVQQTILWALPGSGFRDWPKAQAVLDAVLKDSGDHAPGVVALAHLLQAHFTEQRRLDDSVAVLERRVRDEQQRVRDEQAKVREEQARFRDEQQKLREEQRRADALQQKLDALKGIEKNLLERGNRTRPATKAP